MAIFRFIVVMGAVGGGAPGHQFGGGSGQAVLTVMGTPGGGLFGRRVQNGYTDRRAGQPVIVKSTTALHSASPSRRTLLFGSATGCA